MPPTCPYLYWIQSNGSHWNRQCRHHWVLLGELGKCILSSDFQGTVDQSDPNKRTDGHILWPHQWHFYKRWRNNGRRWFPLAPNWLVWNWCCHTKKKWEIGARELRLWSGSDVQSSRRSPCVSFQAKRKHMMTSSNGNIFRVTGHLCGEFTGPRWIPRTKAGDTELWPFLSSASE